MNRGQHLNLALLHHPVLNRNREVIGSAVTNLDIHDIARMARTYGVARYFISTPWEEQHRLVEELLAHWQNGHGSQSNPARKEALSRVRLAFDLEEVISEVEREEKQSPLVIATSAIRRENTVTWNRLRRQLDSHRQVLLVFGTAHGLAPEVLERADYSLPPIAGGSDYNHLSVRSAAAIIVDRLLGSYNTG